MNNEELYDVKPPIDLPANYFALWVVLAVIITMAIVWWLYRWVAKNKKSKKAETIVIKSPWEIAYERLQELKKRNLIAQERSKEYYITLSDIARRYIEDRFNIKAPEMTTEEFLNSLRSAQELRSEHKNILKDFLNFCDMVKFARYTSSAAEAEQGFELVKRLVEETRETKDHRL